MMRAAKWVAIILAATIVLAIAAILIIPALVDLNAYKPEIEKKVTEATGRPFTLGGDIKLSLFPWAGVALSDLRLGNPLGFKSRDFVSVKAFEVRVKVMPLLKKNLEVEKFVVTGPRIYLLRDQKGRANWEGLGKAPAPPGPKVRPEAEKTPSELPIAALAVGEFMVKDGIITMVDELKGTSREVSDIQIALADVSFDRPLRLSLSAKMEGRPVSLEGTLGPVGKVPGVGTVSIDMALKALGELNASIKGSVMDLALGRKFDMALKIEPFSPRKVTELLGEKFPLDTADPQALTRVSAGLRVTGDPNAVELKEALIELDQTKVALSAALSEFHRPKADFAVEVDNIDLDRYLPKASEEKANPKAPQGAKADMSPMRKPLIEGTVKIGELKAKGAKAQNIILRLGAKDGVFEIKPMSMDLYQGKMSLRAHCDMSIDVPAMAVELQADGIQARPLLSDLAKKDFIEGTLKAAVDLRTKGMEPAAAKQNLNGKAEIVFADGAIVGIDIAGLIRDAKVALGLERQSGDRPRTDFSELRAPFIIEKGVARTEETTMASPLLRLLAKGSADLNSETLDFRVEPKLVATLKGQGDEKQRAGLEVPFLIKGTFSSPTVAPDLQGMLKQGLEKGLEDPSKLKEGLKQGLPGGLPAIPGMESPLKR